MLKPGAINRYPPTPLAANLFLLETDDMTVPRLLLALLFLPSLAIADESEVVPLWPGGAPGYEGKKSQKEKIVG